LKFAVFVLKSSGQKDGICSGIIYIYIYVYMYMYIYIYIYICASE
jgi:hypothetical protein